jgi:hypothetical protein
VDLVVDYDPDAREQRAAALRDYQQVEGSGMRVGPPTTGDHHQPNLTDLS